MSSSPSLYTPFSLSEIIPGPTDKQPRCVTTYDENRFTVGYVSGDIVSFERNQLGDKFTLMEDSTHRIASGIIFGINQVPEGHETLTETSLLIGGGDKALRNVLVDGTELFAVTPQTHPDIAHTAAVDTIVIGSDSRKTLITSGWDGLIKFWRGDDCLMSLQLKNQYASPFCVVNENQLVVGSGSKIMSMITINFDKLYAVYDQRSAELEASDQMGDVDEFGVALMSNGAVPAAPKVAMLNDQYAITHDVVQYLDFKQDAHDHAIRRILPLYQTLSDAQHKRTSYVASIGNDGFLRVWDIAQGRLEQVVEFEVLQSSGDQSEFLYDVIQNFAPQYRSEPSSELHVVIACDDRTLRQIDVSAAINGKAVDQGAKVTSVVPMLTSDVVVSSYHSPFEIQCIELPAVPRALLALRSADSMGGTSTAMGDEAVNTTTNHNDFIVVTPGGVYTFSADPTRVATAELVKTFSATIEANIEKAKKMSNIDLEALPGVETLLQAGEKDGQHKIVNISGKSMVVQWSVNRYEWVLIGEAMGSNNAQGQGNKKEYQGNFYDHVVDVDAGGDKKLTLAFNSDDDPHDVAQAFIIKHQIDVGATMQIVQFISPYIDQRKLQKRKDAAALAKLNQLSDFIQTSWAYSTRSTINNTLIQNAMSKRIQGFAASDPSKLWPNATGVIATDKIFAHLCWVTQQAPLVQPEAYLNANDAEALRIMLSTWPSEDLTPVLDIVRVLAYEGNANNVLFNATAPTYNEPLNQLLSMKLHQTFQAGLGSNDQNGFASLSLCLDILSNAMSRRTNLRALPAQLDLFNNVFPPILSMVQSTNPITNANLATYITASPTGLKLLPTVYRLVHNITSFCNRVGSQPISTTNQSQTQGLPEIISSTITNWVTFLMSILAALPVTADGTWDKDLPIYANLVDAAHMVGFEVDCFVKLKQTLIASHKALFTSTFPKSLQLFITTMAKTREEQNQATTLIRDFGILFGSLNH